MGGLASSRQRTTAVSPPSRPLTELRGGEFPVHAWRQHQYSGRWDRVFQKRERSVDGAVTRVEQRSPLEKQVLVDRADPVTWYPLSLLRHPE